MASKKFKQACLTSATDRYGRIDLDKLITTATTTPEAVYKRLRSAGWKWSTKRQCWFK